KHGENQPGYWLFPTSSDEPPIPDLPENGGETSSGLREGLGFFGDGPIPQVGWYPHVTSPWGAMDMSGGWPEWTETLSTSLISRVYDGGGG
ncbi:MAG: hypothetical protein ACYTF7_02820, partial [Planctomycetota bacterium]